MVELRCACVLAMRLVRHILREQNENKILALPLVPTLLNLLPCGIGSSDCLTELFTNNEKVDRVPDSTIMMFLELIRTKMRHQRYIRFLETLCSSQGKAVRPNQWRIARMLLEEAPELLIQIELESDGKGQKKIMVSGDARYFPKLASGSLELAEWLLVTEPETGAYFAACCSLYASLVRGRNLRVTPTMQRLLPYDLVLAIVHDPRLNETALDVCRQFVTIARDLYVSNDLYGPRDAASGVAHIAEAHPKMVIVKSVRKWAEVADLSDAKQLSSRFNLDRRSKEPGSTVVVPDWTRFDGLKRYILSFLSNFTKQNAMQIKENLMVLELTRLLHDLLYTGFYRSREVPDIVQPMLQLLDGREDVVGLDGATGDADTRARFRKATTRRYNTVIIMKAKRQVCEVLQLICTMRLDIRLSLLLGIYHSTTEQETAKRSSMTNRTSERRGSLLGRDSKLARESTRTMLIRHESSYHEHLSFDQLFEVLSFGSMRTSLGSVSSDSKPSGLRKSSQVVPEPAQAQGSDLVSILLDLTYYDDPELVSAALGLLVRQFE